MESLSNGLATALADNKRLQVALDSIIVNFEPTVKTIAEHPAVNRAIVEKPIAVEAPVTVATHAAVDELDTAAIASLVAGVCGGEGAPAPSAVAPAEKVPAVATGDAVRAAYAPEATVATAAVTTESAVLVEAASAVADAFLVTPGLMRGQGEIVVRLKPEVLDGTEVRISVTGRELAVTFEPVTTDATVLIERCQPQLAAHLSAKIAAFNVSVDVRKKRS